jgi:hypothetical protein
MFIDILVRNCTHVVFMCVCDSTLLFFLKKWLAPLEEKLYYSNIQLVFTFILTVLFNFFFFGFDYFLYFGILFSLFKIKYSTCLLETISGGAVVRDEIQLFICVPHFKGRFEHFSRVCCWWRTCVYQVILRILDWLLDWVTKRLVMVI